MGQEITNTDFWTKFTRIVSASESIRSVKLTDVLGDAGLEVLASEFPSNLESLVVWRCPRVTHEAWFGFSEKLLEAKNLRLKRLHLGNSKVATCFDNIHWIVKMLTLPSLDKLVLVDKRVSPTFAENVLEKILNSSTICVSFKYQIPSIKLRQPS